MARCATARISAASIKTQRANLDDVEFEAFKKRWFRFVEKWKPLLFLNSWEFVWEFDRKGDTIEANDDNATALAETNANWKYAHARIDVNVRDTIGRSDFDLEGIIVHELLHCALNEMREAGIEHEERVVSLLQRSLMLTEQRAGNDMAVVMSRNLNRDLKKSGIKKRLRRDR